MVTTAEDMHAAVMKHATASTVVMAAAVADFTPAEPVPSKIKKDQQPENVSIRLQRTSDILAALGAQKSPNQVIVGFALEYTNVVEYATEKLHRKHADMIVANQAGVPNSGFGEQMNTITLVRPTVPPAPYPPMSKRACAEVVLDAIIELHQQKAAH
jgi:phosphopantothenoylcysteine decarboxylase/phosphopantothenate--cysteine ligase